MNAHDKDHAVAEQISRRTGKQIDLDTANTLRRAALTLHRWAELECGDGNDYASWAIERDESYAVCTQCGHKQYGDEVRMDCRSCGDVAPVRHISDGKPYLHTYPRTGKDFRHAIPDRERGALRRVERLCNELGLHYYHQTDPRGCALYVSSEPLTDNNYNNEVAI